WSSDVCSSDLRWGPWLDNQHSNPAAPCELRWYARIAGEDVEVENGEPFERDGETIYPKSRTLIPSSLKDNPYQRGDYVATLQGLPEPLRSQLLYGDFSIGRTDDPWQVIPTAWVEAAMHRWAEHKKPFGPMTTAGCDIARGGNDKTVIVPRWGNWFGPVQRYPGQSTPSGQDSLKVIQEALVAGGGGTANIDV